MLMADASTHFVAESIDFQVYYLLGEEWPTVKRTAVVWSGLKTGIAEEKKKMCRRGFIGTAIRWRDRGGNRVA